MLLRRIIIELRIISEKLQIIRRKFLNSFKYYHPSDNARGGSAIIMGDIFLSWMTILMSKILSGAPD